MPNDLVLAEPQALARQDGPLQPADLMAGIHRLASDPNTDVAKMEALIRLLTEQQDRTARAEFNRAMVACQAQMPHIHKDGKTNNGRYATLENIDNFVRKIYEAHGFSVSYNTGEARGKELDILAAVRHSAGHVEHYKMPLTLDTSGSKNPTQGAGSTLSYGRRYLLKAIFNIIEEGEDNDGNGAPSLITKAQASNLVTRLDALGSDKAKFCQYLGISTLEELPAIRYQDADRELRRAEAKGKP